MFFEFTYKPFTSEEKSKTLQGEKADTHLEIAGVQSPEHLAVESERLFLTGQTTLGELLNLSEAYFPHFQNRVWSELDEVMS